MAVKGLHPELGIEKSKKCQLLLFRTVMEGREVVVSSVAFSPGAQGLSPQSVAPDQQCGRCGEPVRNAGSQAAPHTPPEGSGDALQDPGEAHYHRKAKRRIFPAQQDHLGAFKSYGAWVPSQRPRVIGLRCGRAL
uniref:Uncharacterized protein n=1 Tax=Myotis myotis TaxID=51298 RepID=A0A7J7SBS7_MYOMY|nr:hypothetical protein mMyoMyo1_009495 [Myotis myotis]